MIKRPIRPDVGAKQFNAKGAIKPEGRQPIYVKKSRDLAGILKKIVKKLRQQFNHMFNKFAKCIIKINIIDF